ncbi:MAG: deoxyguanosinetriphosphate triphosphohydrolase [Planctomycetota bacterium]|nr:deoxyguanosinetriphosphate triphosphohydrolase [Planctomycetota bacterium]
MNPDLQADFIASHSNRLSPVALGVCDSGGRVHAESAHPYRTCYQRDRDRIVHCSAFRRLDYKTQVFVPHEQDHYRTRLTHTLEVAQVARTLARALRVSEDVAEAVALAHDLGHPPFGHAGEKILNELMAEAGGFEHNRQSLRVVDYLEHPYPDFRGLNLTNAVRLCLARHETRYDSPQIEQFADIPSAPLEGQLVDLADEIAYTSADLSDALSAGWITLERLSELELWRQAWKQAEDKMPTAREIHKRISACRGILGILADDALAETARRIDLLVAANTATTPPCPADVQQNPHRCAAFGDETADRLEQLQQFLLENVYQHPEVLRHHAEAGKIITELFRAYLAEPALLPSRYLSRVDADGLARVICDYIAGMTDRFCRETPINRSK